MNHFDEISDFLEREIVPLYDAFDAGHRRDHVHHVMAEALSLARHYPEVDPSMVLVAAAYHDLGLARDREHHHEESARILREDSRLRSWFTSAQINVMADAAEDHRASSSREPRTIYGLLVAEADRQIDGEVIMRRTLQYGLEHYPTLDREEQYCRLMEHVGRKYATGGYLKLWIPHSGNARRLAAFRALLADREALRATFDRLYDECAQSPCTAHHPTDNSHSHSSVTTP